MSTLTEEQRKKPKVIVLMEEEHDDEDYKNVTDILNDFFPHTEYNRVIFRGGVKSVKIIKE